MKSKWLYSVGRYSEHILYTLPAAVQLSDAVIHTHLLCGPWLRGSCDRHLVAFAGQDSVPHIVPVFLALQAAQQGCKGCLVNEAMVQGYSNIHLVKGVIDCTHQLRPLHKLFSVRAYNAAQAVHC